MEGYISFMENALDQQNRHIDGLEQYIRRLCLRSTGIPVFEDKNADTIIKNKRRTAFCTKTCNNLTPDIQNAPTIYPPLKSC